MVATERRKLAETIDELKELQASLAEAKPAGDLVRLAKTIDQACCSVVSYFVH